MDGVEVIGLLALGGAGATVGCVAVLRGLLRRFLALDDATDSAVAPVLAILVGIGWNWLLLSYLRADDARVVTIVLFGLMSGLAASGLWSGSKAAVVEPMRDAVPHG